MNSSNLDLHELDAIIERAKEALKSTGLVRELEDLKVKYLGKKGEVTSILRTMGKLPADFIEGMACVGGCIGGAGCLTHGPKDKGEVDKYGHEAYEKTITAALAQCAYDAEK